MKSMASLISKKTSTIYLHKLLRIVQPFFEIEMSNLSVAAVTHHRPKRRRLLTPNGTTAPVELSAEPFYALLEPSNKITLLDKSQRLLLVAHHQT